MFKSLGEMEGSSVFLFVGLYPRKSLQLLTSTRLTSPGAAPGQVRAFFSPECTARQEMEKTSKLSLVWQLCAKTYLRLSGLPIKSLSNKTGII